MRHASIAAVILAAGLLSPVALAKGPTVEEALAGKAVLSAREFPASFASDAQFIATMRRMRTRVFRAKKKGVWELHAMVFFPIALDEGACDLHFFDVTHKKETGKSTHVDVRTQFLAHRGERSMASTLILKDPPFKKDHTYRLIVARRSDRGLLADAYFTLKGPR